MSQGVTVNLCGETVTEPQRRGDEILQHQLLSQHVTLIPDEGHRGRHESTETNVLLHVAF